MAGKRGILLQEDIALAAATEKTVLQIVAAANHPIEITEIGVGFDGVTNTNESVEVVIERQTDAGTMTGGTITKANDSDGDTFDTTGQHTATSEPTTDSVIRKWRVHPQTGFVYQPGTENPIHVGAGDRVAIVCTAADAVNIDAYICFEE